MQYCKKCGEDLSIKVKQGWVKSGDICGECKNKIIKKQNSKTSQQLPPSWFNN